MDTANTKLKKENEHLANLMQDIRNCPESEQAQKLLDVQAENDELKEELKAGNHLCATLTDRQHDLESRNAKFREALQALYYAQHGPPLRRHKKLWQDAMTLAGDVLKE